MQISVFDVVCITHLRNNIRLVANYVAKMQLTNWLYVILLDFRRVTIRVSPGFGYRKVTIPSSACRVTFTLLNTRTNQQLTITRAFRCSGTPDTFI